MCFFFFAAFVCVVRARPLLLLFFFVVFLFKLNGRSLSTLARARAREILFFFWVPPTVSILYDMEWMYWNGSVDSSMKLLWITMESL